MPSKNISDLNDDLVNKLTDLVMSKIGARVSQPQQNTSTPQDTQSQSEPNIQPVAAHQQTAPSQSTHGSGGSWEPDKGTVPVLMENGIADIPAVNIPAALKDHPNWKIGVDLKNRRDGSMATIPAVNAQQAIDDGVFEEIPSIPKRITRFVEDVVYPSVGAWGGGALGLAIGGPPGAVAGAMLGGAAGEAVKRGVRHFTDPQANADSNATGDILTSGAMGAIQEGPMIWKAARAGLKAAPGIAKAAEEFGIPVLDAQLEKTGFRQAVADFKMGAINNTTAFTKFSDAQKAVTTKAAEKLAEHIGGVKGTSTASGELIQDMLTHAESEVSKGYEDALVQISKHGADRLPVDVSGKLKTAAQGFIDELKLPEAYSAGLRDAQGRNTVLNFLGNFTKEQSEQLTWEEARRMRSQIRALTESGEVNIGNGALKQFNHTLNEAMGDALKDGGHADLAEAFQNASTRFREVSDILETKTLQRLAIENPEKVADVLMRGGIETDMSRLRSIITSQNMKVVEENLWQRLVAGATKDETLDGVALAKKFANLSANVKQAIWTHPDTLAKVERFVQVAKMVSEKSQPSVVKTGRFARLAGPTSLGGLGGGYTGIHKFKEGDIVGGIGDVVGGMALGMTIGIGSGMVMHLTSEAIAKMMLKPANIDLMTRALLTKPGSKAGLDVTRKLMWIASQVTQKGYRPVVGAAGALLKQSLNTSEMQQAPVNPNPRTPSQQMAGVSGRSSGVSSLMGQDSGGDLMADHLAEYHE